MDLIKKKKVYNSNRKLIYVMAQSQSDHKKKVLTTLLILEKIGSNHSFSYYLKGYHYYYS